MSASPDLADLWHWFVIVGVGIVAAVVVHELGHVLAAGALGATRIRLGRLWPTIRIEAELPPGRGELVAFLAAGALANFGAAGALAGFGDRFWVAAVLQAAFGVLALAPTGTSDGARLLAAFRDPSSRRR